MTKIKILLIISTMVFSGCTTTKGATAPGLLGSLTIPTLANLANRPSEAIIRRHEDQPRDPGSGPEAAARAGRRAPLPRRRPRC